MNSKYARLNMALKKLIKGRCIKKIGKLALDKKRVILPNNLNLFKTNRFLFEIFVASQIPNPNSNTRQKGKTLTMPIGKTVLLTNSIKKRTNKVDIVSGYFLSLSKLLTINGNNKYNEKIVPINQPVAKTMFGNAQENQKQNPEASQTN